MQFLFGIIKITKFECGTGKTQEKLDRLSILPLKTECHSRFYVQ